MKNTIIIDSENYVVVLNAFDLLRNMNEPSFSVLVESVEEDLLVLDCFSSYLAWTTL